MSKNIIQTIGQHVFKYDPPLFTEENVPVLAGNSKSADNVMLGNGNGREKYQFLGEGYYFWDDNIERAHKWGKTRCEDKYLVLELPLVLQGNRFLDLVGSRQDLRILVEALNAIRDRIPDLKLGAFFHMMQTMEKIEPGSWPFSIIRALNVKSNTQKIDFNHVPDSKMLLNPEIIICFYDKKELNLQSRRYIDKNDNQWTPKI